MNTDFLNPIKLISNRQIPTTALRSNVLILAFLHEFHHFMLFDKLIVVNLIIKVFIAATIAIKKL